MDDHPVLGAARAGVVIGPTVQRDGDVFGPFVHLAARLVGEAEVGTALVSTAVADAVRNRAGFAVTPTGERSLKGFDSPVDVFVVRRADHDSPVH